MGSKAASQAKLPGIPDVAACAWIGGLIDRSGGFATNPIGLKITGPYPLCRQLYIVAGGRIVAPEIARIPGPRATWWQTRQADLRVLLPRIRPHVRVRYAQLDAMVELLEHLETRKSYHGDKRFRAKREQLRGDVARARLAA